MYYQGLALGGRVTETGFDPSPALPGLLSWISGADKKAERAAKAQRDAALAAERTAIAQLEAARLSAMAQQPAPTNVLASLGRPSPLGVSWGAVVGVAAALAVGLYLWRR